VRVSIPAGPTTEPAGSGPLPATEDDDLRGSVARSVRWIVLDKWGVRLCTLVVFTLLGRLLDPSEIGLVALATVFTALLGVFVDSGFSQALVQRKTVDRVTTSTAFWISMGQALALAAALVVAAPFLAEAYGQPQLTDVLRVLSLSLPLSALSGMPSALLERSFGFRTLAVRNVASAVVGSVAAIGLAVAGAGVWALVAQILLSSVVNVAVLWTASTWRPSFAFSLRAARQLWSFGSNVLGIELVNLGNAQADKLLVGTLVSPTALGYYFIGSRIVQILFDMLTAVLGRISLTTFAKMQDDHPRMVRTLTKLTFANAVIAFLAFGLCAALAPLLVPLVFGDKWQDSVSIMQLLAPASALTAITWFDKGVLLGAGKPRAALGIAVAQLFLGLGLLAAAAPFGVHAVAASRSLRVLLFWPVRLRTLKKHIGLRIWPYTRQFIAPALAAAACVGLVLGLQALDLTGENRLVTLVVLAPVGVAAYLAVMAVLAREATLEVLQGALGSRLPGRLRRA
jgi:PST family polysaccharide transporter